MLRQLATVAAVFALGLGCGQPLPPDAGQEDAGEEDAGFDAGLDDAGFDAGFDGGLDAGFDAGIPTNSQEHREMLRGLGFTTNVGERGLPDGGALPVRWHPLRTHYASFFPRKEIYVAGGPVLAGQAELYLDDKVAAYAALPLAREPDQTWIQAQFKNGIAVDLDDDGLDELFIVYFAPGSGTLKYLVLDPNDAKTPVNGVITLNTHSDNLDALTQPSLAVGDLDGDGRAEIAIGFGNLYILEGDGDGQFTVLTRTFYDFNEVNVAIGNIDQDPQDELIVTHTENRPGNFRGYYEIFDGSMTTPMEDGELQFVDYNATDTHFGETRIAIGDIDGDRMPDIVFHGRRIIPGDNAWMLFAMQYRPIVPRPTDKHFVFRTFTHYTNNTGVTTPRTLVVADFDGDGTREMFGWGQVISYRAGNSGTVKYGGVPGWTRAVSANIDGDRRDDLLVTTSTALQIWGLDALDNWVRKTEITGTGVTYDSPVLATPNADGDSALVRYDGDYELLFTDPQLVTVMASPPWQEGVGQDVSATTATFGRTSGTTVVTSDSLGLSVGYSVGFEYESDLFQAGISAKSTFEAAFDFYATETRSVQSYFSYTTAPGTDKVVFTTVPFDVYYYTIVSSPRASEVGKVVTVNLPRQPQTLGTSIGFYNAHNGAGLDIDTRILQHVPGQVWSYPTLDDRNTILAQAERDTPSYQRLWNGPQRVDESGSNTLGLSTESGSARGSQMNFSTTFEFEAKAGGATVGGSIGFSYGHTFEVSTQTGAVYEGTVGEIPAPAFGDAVYCYGLMVYPQVLATQRFIVLNWWTQKECVSP